MSKQLKKQINALTAQVAAMKVAKQPSASAKKKKRNRNKSKRGPRVSNEGKIVVQRSELLCELNVAATAASTSCYAALKPSGSHLPWLAKLSASFTQIIWHSARLEYRPAVGAMKDGSLVVGVDWDPESTSPSKAKVQSCSPNFQVPVWQKKEIAIPSSRLQSRRFYTLSEKADKVDQSPCEILAYLSCTANKDSEQYFGDIWVHYNVTLQGPTS